MAKRFPEDFEDDTSLDGSEPMIVGNKKVAVDVLVEHAIGAPDGSTPGSVLARLDDAEGDIASLGAAVGPLPVAIDALDTRVDALEAGTAGVRTVTGNATLDGTERVLIIDAAGAVEITLDEGAAERNLAILWSGDPALRGLTLIRDGGTGTINGAAASYSTYALSGAGLALRLWATAPHEWFVDTLIYEAMDLLFRGSVPEAYRLRTTTAGPHSIDVRHADVCQAYAGAMTYQLPPAVAGRRVNIVKETTDPGEITLDPDGTDTIHGSTDPYVLDGSDYVASATTYRRAWTLVCYEDGNWLVA